LANPVGQQLPFFRTPSNRIGDDPLIEMPRDDHGATAKENPGIGRRAPHELPGETRFGFVRVKLTPYCRMNAIGANQNISII